MIPVRLRLPIRRLAFAKVKDQRIFDLVRRAHRDRVEDGVNRRVETRKRKLERRFFAVRQRRVLLAAHARVVEVRTAPFDGNEIPLAVVNDLRGRSYLRAAGSPFERDGYSVFARLERWRGNARRIGEPRAMVVPAPLLADEREIELFVKRGNGQFERVYFLGKSVGIFDRLDRRLDYRGALGFRVGRLA